MDSSDLNLLGKQGQLPLRVRAESNSIPVETIRRLRTSGHAFSTACMSSGLEDQEIAEQCGIDAGTFSKIKKGGAALHEDLIVTFCDVVGNRIYPEWIASRLGCTLVEIKSAAELRAEALEAALNEERAKRHYAESLLVRRAA